MCAAPDSKTAPPGLSAPELLRRYRSWVTLGLMEMTVAHRLRNLLMSMVGSMTFLHEAVEKGQPTARFFSEMDNALLGASNYTRWLQLLAERRKVTIASTNLHDCCRAALECVEDELQPGIPIRFEPSEELPEVAVDSVLVMLMLVELLAAPSVTLARVTPEETDNGARSLSLRTGIQEDASISSGSGPRRNAELKIQARGFRPWSGGSLPMEGMVVQDEFFKVHYSIEMARSVMRLFHGEVRLMESEPLGEDAVLSFPVQG